MKVELTQQFKKWFDKLKDIDAKTAIAFRVESMQSHEKILGDWKPVGDDVIEFRLHIGPGYRLYAAKEGAVLLLLLLGGSKASQKRDIKHAKRILKDWRKHHAR